MNDIINPKTTQQRCQLCEQLGYKNCKKFLHCAKNFQKLQFLSLLNGWLFACSRLGSSIFCGGRAFSTARINPSHDFPVDIAVKDTLPISADYSAVAIVYYCWVSALDRS
jgi:hypothetical protein